MNRRVLLINLPIQRGKRTHYGLLPFQKSLNYGLLSIASHVKSEGWHPQIFDPQVYDNWDTANRALEDLLSNYSWLLIGFSCISGFSYPSLRTLSDLAKTRCPSAYLVAGGQDHVGRIPYTTLRDNPSLDAVICGEGELPLKILLDRLIDGRSVTDIPDVQVRGLHFSPKKSWLFICFGQLKRHG